MLIINLFPLILYGLDFVSIYARFRVWKSGDGVLPLLLAQLSAFRYAKFPFFYFKFCNIIFLICNFCVFVVSVIYLFFITLFLTFDLWLFDQMCDPIKRKAKPNPEILLNISPNSPFNI